MSVCVAFNLSDGVVMAVDSATTMVNSDGSISKVFMDVDKLFQLSNLKVGIATYGVAALEGRTIGSFVREFSVSPANNDLVALPLSEIVERLRVFFFEHYKDFAEKIHGAPFDQIPNNAKGTLGLVIGGFSANSFQSELWHIIIPEHATPGSSVQLKAPGVFGLNWFATSLPIERYLLGFDWSLLNQLEADFKAILGRDLTQPEIDRCLATLRQYEYQIQVNGMPIQGGIDCAKFLVNIVLGHYRFVETHPIVGGKAKVGVVAYDHSAFRILE